LASIGPDDFGTASTSAAPICGFKVTALAYLTGQARRRSPRTEAAVTSELNARLREKPWLLVLTVGAVWPPITAPTPQLRMTRSRAIPG